MRTAAASLFGGLALASLLAVAAVAPAQAAGTANERASRAQPAAPSDASRAYWTDIKGAAPAVSARGAMVAVRPAHFRTSTLDRNGMAALAATAPAEFSAAARQNPLVISLPDPAGGFQRFRIVDSPVMQPGLAARHPDIRTYAGRGLDDPSATLRMDITPLGLHASVFSTKGAWYIDPYFHLDDSLYVSYWRRDLSNARAPFSEGLISEAQLSLSRGRYHAADTVRVDAIGFAPGAQVVVTVRNSAAGAAPRQPVQATASRSGTVSVKLPADPYRNLGSFEVTASDGRISATSNYQVVADKVALDTAVGDQLRSYRLALLTDPGYANFFGGSANVTAAKVTLINRVSQVYETETSIRMMLIDGNDALNLDTAAQMTGANGPCGGAACYSASQAGSCTGSTLSRTRVVIGLLAGASNFDIGHIALGVSGGGVASLGVVGGSSKAQGCTGIPQPVGDAFAVDYVAHEMGHQFAGNHTFNGTVSNCSGGNRNPGTSVEPGSGSSVMAYAGICGSDNLQAHSDPYWSQRSFDEITTYTSAAENNLSDIQVGVLSGFNTAGQQFQLRYNGNDSAPIVRGTNFTTAGVKAAVEGIAGWPVGATVSVSQLSDNAFTVSFGGALAGVNAATLSLVACSGGCTGYVGEVTAGGPTARGGTVSPTGNSSPLVSVAASYTIPLRTPFVLTGSASDADNTPTTYMWEQNDRGANAGTGLISNAKTDGPLFRQFGTRALVSNADTQLYSSPGENATTTDPTRIFPDMAQILANNTNAETGVCTTVAGSPTPQQIDCYSEYLPTASYVGVAGVNASPLSLNFKLTARDGSGGVNSASTTLLLATNAGPFLVTSPNTAVSLDSGSAQTVTWDVAGTNVAPVSTANVKISLSVDGGGTFPFTLAASTPNTGSRSVTLPALGTTRGRVKVEAVGNVYFDVSNADFTIRLLGDVDSDGAVTCLDVRQVRSALGSAAGQPGFDPRNDVNNDGVVDVRDLAYVSQRLTSSTRCQ
ncbi:MAG: M12 family metallo-peptidase [Pseudomonadota bacterium]|nr:M12 family metallo-peptidase [Pseudomonadota bacterium]